LTNFMGIWLVKSVPTKFFYAISYVLLATLGAVLFGEGCKGLL
jgi:hypothetical protein